MVRYLQIGKVNLRLSLLPNLLLSVVLLLLSPLVMGVENLDASRTAAVLEMFVALIGIILITPIILPEQNKDIRDLVEAKYTSITVILLIRLIEAIVSLAILIGGYTIFLRLNHCDFPPVPFYLGTLAEALFVGGIGFCAYSIFNQIAIAYMLPIVYYIVSISPGKQLLKNFYLFSMRYGSYREKYYLAMVGVILIVFGLGYPYLVKRILPKLTRRE